MALAGRHLRFKEMVPPQRQDRRRGICRKCPHCLSFPHLAQIQVRLQVIGVIELQDPPEWSPFPALPGGEGGGRETMSVKDEKGDGQGAGVTLMGHPPQLLLTPCPSPGSHSLIGQEDADVLLQTKKVGQVHGRGQVPRCVNKLERGQREMSLEWAGASSSQPRAQSHDILA